MCINDIKASSVIETWDQLDAVYLINDNEREGNKNIQTYCFVE